MIKGQTYSRIRAKYQDKQDSPFPKKQQVSKRERSAFNDRNVEWLKESVKKDEELLNKLFNKQL